MHIPDADVDSRAASLARPGSAKPTLIVFSHLRWGFVFQRPQHLLTRLARDFQVLFVEEPVAADGPARFASNETPSGVEVLTPHTPLASAGFADDQLAVMATLLAGLTATRGISHPIVWLYTPMALPLVAGLAPRALVYDCMDDLASFRFAPAQLVERESSLMRLADLVLTGGPSLYERRKHLGANVHCLPSAVDAAHFAADRLRETAPEHAAAAALHAGLAHPRLGFFGVIDERLDIALVAAVADLRPDWQVVMVGPVVKIDPATLPQRPNIRWIGMQGYDTLPYLQSHWDVCILPFALNESTRFISPTKTLEYLAGDKPVVSTPILDVASLYGSVVRIAPDAASFVAAADAAMREAPPAREARRRAARALVDGCTWDGTAARIRTLLDDIVRAPRSATTSAPPAATFDTAEPDASNDGRPVKAAARQAWASNEGSGVTASSPLSQPSAR